MYAPSMHRFIPPPPAEYVTVADVVSPLTTVAVCVVGFGVYEVHEPPTGAAVIVYTPGATPERTCVPIRLLVKPLGPVTVMDAGTLAGRPATFTFRVVPAET